MGSRRPERKRMSRWANPWGGKDDFCLPSVSDHIFFFLLGWGQWFVRFVIGDSCQSGLTSNITSSEGCLLSEDAWMHQ